jgi:hypothetical protein
LLFTAATAVYCRYISVLLFTAATLRQHFFLKVITANLPNFHLPNFHLPNFRIFKFLRIKSSDSISTSSRYCYVPLAVPPPRTSPLHVPHNLRYYSPIQPNSETVVPNISKIPAHTVYLPFNQLFIFFYINIYGGVCYSERMLQRTVFINKIRMLQLTRRNTIGRSSTRVRMTCRAFPL